MKNPIQKLHFSIKIKALKLHFSMKNHIKKLHFSENSVV